MNYRIDLRNNFDNQVQEAYQYRQASGLQDAKTFRVTLIKEIQLVLKSIFQQVRKLIFLATQISNKIQHNLSAHTTDTLTLGITATILGQERIGNAYAQCQR